MQRTQPLLSPPDDSTRLLHSPLLASRVFPAIVARAQLSHRPRFSALSRPIATSPSHTPGARAISHMHTPLASPIATSLCSRRLEPLKRGSRALPRAPLRCPSLRRVRGVVAVQAYFPSERGEVGLRLRRFPDGPVFWEVHAAIQNTVISL